MWRHARSLLLAARNVTLPCLSPNGSGWQLLQAHLTDIWDTSGLGEHILSLWGVCRCRRCPHHLHRSAMDDYSNMIISLNCRRSCLLPSNLHATLQREAHHRRILPATTSTEFEHALGFRLQRVGALQNMRIHVYTYIAFAAFSTHKQVKQCIC